MNCDCPNCEEWGGLTLGAQSMRVRPRCLYEDWFIRNQYTRIVDPALMFDVPMPNAFLNYEPEKEEKPVTSTPPHKTCLMCTMTSAETHQLYCPVLTGHTLPPGSVVASNPLASATPIYPPMQQVILPPNSDNGMNTVTFQPNPVYLMSAGTQKCLECSALLENTDVIKHQMWHQKQEQRFLELQRRTESRVPKPPSRRNKSEGKSATEQSRVTTPPQR